MRARAPLMIQDPEISQMEVGRLVEDWTKIDEDHYLDGPVTPRVAVIDLDPNTEALVPGAVFIPPEGRRVLGSYKVDRQRIYSAHFIQVSVFATVLRTMYMYEEPDTLGRRVAWGFEAPQLLVVPRAGWWANAYYERRSHSLQFFSFRAGNKLIHTSLSRDIVAHETAHALIDGIDPDIYDALDPQSLALHEGIADLTAMLLAFSSRNLTEAILGQTNGSIRKSTNFSSIGEQFGRAIDPDRKAGWLRNLLNDATLPANQDDEPEEHELSEVISGVLYGFMVALHEHFKREVAAQLNLTEFSASGRALAVAASLFQRMVLRGLDYLPPGEVTFADFGRAILAADQASFPDDTWRRWLREHFVERGIVPAVADLDVVTNVEDPAVAEADLQGLADSPWVAYTFAEQNRELLGIPPDVQFEVLKRVVVDGRFESPEATLDREASRGPAAAEGDAADDAEPAEGAAGGRAEPPADADGETGVPFRELLFKVRWSVVEPNPPDLGASERRVQTGTTLVIDWNAKRIRSLLRPKYFDERRPARDRMMRRLVESGVVEVTEPATGPARRPQATGIDAVVTDGILRVRNTARLLHIVRDIGE